MYEYRTYGKRLPKLTMSSRPETHCHKTLPALAGVLAGACTASYIQYIQEILH